MSDGSASQGTTPNPAGGTTGATVDDGFEDVDRWKTLDGQGSLSTTDDSYVGTQAVHVRGGRRTREGHLAREFESPVDVRGVNVSLAVKVESHDLAKVALQLHAPDEGNVVESKRTVAGPKGRWIRLNFGVTGVTGDPDLSSVRELRIVGRPRDPNARRPVEFLVDDLRTGERPETGAVVFTFDDAFASHYRAHELLADRGFAAVEGLIPESVGGRNRLSQDQLEAMADSGWDVAAHPNVGSRPFPEYSVKEQERLLADAQEELRESGFEDGARHLLVPKNLLGPETFDLARNRYETVFSFGGSPNGLPLEHEDAVIGRIDGKNADEVKRFVDYAAEYGQLVVPMFHRIGDDGDLTVAEFEDLLRHVEERDVEVLTASDLLDR